MEGAHDESNAVGNPHLTNKDGQQQDIPNSDRIYQQQYPQNQIQNQPPNIRPTEIPAAKVCNFGAKLAFFLTAACSVLF